jgi:hypothetical protein
MASSTQSPIECFAKAIQLISLAAVVDERIAVLVPTIAECFISVSSRPNARAPLKFNLSAEVDVEFPKGTEPQIILLHKAIRVLSLCVADCPHEASRLIPVISVYMIPKQQLSSFPLSIDKGEIGACSKDHIDKANMESVGVDSSHSPSKKNIQDNVAVDIARTTKCPNENVLSSSRSQVEDQSEISTKHSLSVIRDCPTRNDVISLLSPISSPMDKDFANDSTVRETSRKICSNEAGEDEGSNYPPASSDPSSPDSPNSALSSTSTYNQELRGDKRKEIAADSQELLLSGARIPKRLKVTQPSNHSTAVTNAYPKKPSFGIQSTLSFPLLKQRFKEWKQFLNYKPRTKCVPIDTYFAVIITNPLESEVLKCFKDEEECDTDLQKYLSIIKIVLIPRAVKIGSTMAYCLGNLHKYLHGTLHLKSDQELHFKAATAHLEVKILEPGDQFDDIQNAIHVKYKYESRFTSLSTLLTQIAPKMDSSCSSSRKVPSISCGWSTANAHEYKRNRINMVGSISPFLIEGGINALESLDRKKIAGMICQLIRLFSPCGRNPSPFFHSDPKMRLDRAQFAAIFLKSLVDDDCVKSVEGFFRAEGVSFIFNNFVSFHTDTMNDPTPGMNDTLSVSCCVEITEEMASISSVKKAMELSKLSTGDPLLFSMMVYSRKCLRDHMKRQNKISAMIDTSVEGFSSINILSKELNWLISPLLQAIQRIDSEVNTNAIWDNPLLMENLRSKVVRDTKTTQYQGDYVSLVAGFDKMRYWSPVRYLADALHAKGLISMTGENLMGYICFSSLETNGTFLLSCIIDNAMCTQDPLNCHFIREVKRYGVYAALIFAANRKNRNTGTGNVYGSSKVPRHQHHNRGSCDRFPIAGGTGLLSFSDGDKEKIAARCQRVVNDMLEMCADAFADMNNARKSHRNNYVDNVALSVYNGIQELGGPGIGHIFTLNFIQVAAMFAFLPYELTTWACVHSKTSGAYKAINSLYRRQVSAIIKETGKNFKQWQSDLSLGDAENYFSSAVKWIQQNVSYNFTHALAENILCELQREEGSVDDSIEWAPSKKRDVLYFFKHRNGMMHHLYRWKTDIKGTTILQVLLVSKNGEVDRVENLSYLSSEKKKDTIEVSSTAAYWEGDPMGVTAVQKDSKYILSDDYTQYFM